MAQSMYCVRCRKKVDVEDGNVTRETTLKGKSMLRATCPTCGIKMEKFIK